MQGSPVQAPADSNTAHRRGCGQGIGVGKARVCSGVCGGCFHCNGDQCGEASGPLCTQASVVPTTAAHPCTANCTQQPPAHLHTAHCMQQPLAPCTRPAARPLAASMGPGEPATTSASSCTAAWASGVATPHSRSACWASRWPPTANRAGASAVEQSTPPELCSACRSSASSVARPCGRAGAGAGRGGSVGRGPPSRGSWGVHALGGNQAGQLVQQSHMGSGCRSSATHDYNRERQERKKRYKVLPASRVWRCSRLAALQWADLCSVGRGALPHATAAAGDCLLQVDGRIQSGSRPPAAWAQLFRVDSRHGAAVRKGREGAFVRQNSRAQSPRWEQYRVRGVNRMDSVSGPWYCRAILVCLAKVAMVILAGMPPLNTPGGTNGEEGPAAGASAAARTAAAHQAAASNRGSTCMWSGGKGCKVRRQALSREMTSALRKDG